MENIFMYFITFINYDIEEKLLECKEGYGDKRIVGITNLRSFAFFGRDARIVAEALGRNKNIHKIIFARYEINQIIERIEAETGKQVVFTLANPRELSK